MIKRKRKKKKQISEKDKAILDLKRQRDKLQKYKKTLTNNMERETQMAKKMLKEGNKKKALLILKKKKYQQQQFDKAEKTILNLEEMVNEIEDAAMNQEVFKAMKEGKDALEALNNEMKIEDVEKIMEDTEEAIAYQQEINEMLNGAFTEEDEEAINAEYEALFADEEQKVADEINAQVVPSRQIEEPETKALLEKDPTEEVAKKKKAVALAT